MATVRNRSTRAMTLQLQFRTDGMVGVYVHGQSFRNLGKQEFDSSRLPTGCRVSGGDWVWCVWRGVLFFFLFFCCCWCRVFLERNGGVMLGLWPYRCCASLCFVGFFDLRLLRPTESWSLKKNTTLVCRGGVLAVCPSHQAAPIFCSHFLFLAHSTRPLSYGFSLLRLTIEVF